jgi:hypothetical protein
VDRHGVLKIAILAPSAVLIGIGFLAMSNQLSNYLTFLDGLFGPNGRDCNGERCICNNLMCVTEARYVSEMLGTLAVGAMFVAAGSFWIVLFAKRDYLKARHIL